MFQEEQYREYRDHLAKHSNKKLVEAFNRQVGNTAWVSSRAVYLRALHDEFVDRGFGLSAVGGAGGMSLGSRIKLRGKKVVPDEKYEGARSAHGRIRWRCYS